MNQEEAAKQWATEQWPVEIPDYNKTERAYVASAFLAGAKWQKEQLESALTRERELREAAEQAMIAANNYWATQDTDELYNYTVQEMDEAWELKKSTRDHYQQLKANYNQLNKEA